MQETIKEMIAVIRPLLELVITLAVPMIALRVTTWLGTKDEKDRAEIEKLLRDAIHASAQNAILYALQKQSITSAELTMPAGHDSVKSAAINIAMEYVKEKNPDALAKLGVSDDNLRDIITAKLPLIPTHSTR